MKVLLTLVLMLTSCSTEPVVMYDYDRSINFADYKTFNWSPKAGTTETGYPQYDNSLNRKRVMKAVESNLVLKGYKKDTINPDLYINIHFVIQSKKIVRSYPTAYPRYRYWPDYQINVYEFNEGSLIIDLIDAKANQIIWQGLVSGALDIKPKEIESAINNAVSLIFSKYKYRVKNE